MELESHLRRIARELAATGVLPELIGLPSATRLPEMTGLSTREIEIVTRLVRGERVPLIAKAMFLSQSTVRNHLTSVYRKLGVGSQQELITLLRVSDDGYDEDPPIAL
jgi:DNA-binding CsgD family transcriptional regulator